MTNNTSAAVTKLHGERAPRAAARRGDCAICHREPVKYKKHALGSRCYNVYRNWDANKTDGQREERKDFLRVSLDRMRAVDDGFITINHLKETIRAKDRNAKTHPLRRQLRR